MKEYARASLWLIQEWSLLTSSEYQFLLAVVITHTSLSGTLWNNWLSEYEFGWNGRAGEALEDNLEIVNNRIIRDKWFVYDLPPTPCRAYKAAPRNWSKQVKVPDDIFRIINELIREYVQIAIVSRNTHRDLYVYSANSAGASASYLTS